MASLFAEILIGTKREIKYHVLCLLWIYEVLSAWLYVDNKERWKYSGISVSKRQSKRPSKELTNKDLLCEKQAVPERKVTFGIRGSSSTILRTSVFPKSWVKLAESRLLI